MRIYYFLFGVVVGLGIYHFIIVSPTITIKEIKCPNGRVCLVFTDPRQAFSYDVQELTVGIRDLQNILKKPGESNSDEKLKVEIKSKTETMIKQLDSINGDLEKHYLAAYSSYLARPCDDEAWKKYQEQLESIRNLQENLRKIKICKEFGEVGTFSKPPGAVAFEVIKPAGAVTFVTAGLETSVAEWAEQASEGKISRLGNEVIISWPPVSHEHELPKTEKDRTP